MAVRDRERQDRDRAAEEPEELLYIGFERTGRPHEVITDTSASTGRVAVIHAHRCGWAQRQNALTDVAV
jgi:hypothetical protein